MKHLEDIQIDNIEISIYQNGKQIILDVKDENGDYIESRVYDI